MTKSKSIACFKNLCVKQTVGDLPPMEPLGLFGQSCRGFGRFQAKFGSAFLGVWLAILVPGFPILAQQTESPAARQAETQSPTMSELNLRYAILRLRVAEIELERAKLHNQEINDAISANLGGSLKEKSLKLKLIPDTTLERLQSNVEIAKERVDYASSGSTARPKQVQLRNAREKARLAEVRLNDAAAGRSLLVKNQSKAQADLTVRRLELLLEIAKLRVELPDKPEYLVERVDILQWQLDSLTDDFMLLEQRIRALEDHQSQQDNDN